MSEPYFVYLLECQKDGTLYAGIAKDPDRRLADHMAGKVKYTRGRLPVRLVWRRECRNQSAALAEERRVKRLSRAEKVALVTMDGCALLTVGLQRWRVVERLDPRDVALLSGDPSL